MNAPNTGYYAKVVCDSVSPDGVRLTTLEVCFPRFILAEFNTHRMFSRNSASSRAIPVAKQLERINLFPFVPEAFPINKPGMSAVEYIYPTSESYAHVREVWLNARDYAVQAVEYLVNDFNVHKQTANRLLEPFMWHTVVVTATEWENFYSLRISPHAQPEINKIAYMMQQAMEKSIPALKQAGEWHLPYVDEEDIKMDNDPWNLAKISAGRCAAVTLLNQDKKDAAKDISRTDGLISNGHMSPLEHPAQLDCSDMTADCGNFRYPWTQLRKMIPNEAVYREPIED